MTHNVESVDLVGHTDQPFQLVVPRKSKNKSKKQQTEVKLGLKVGAFNRTPR